MTSILQRVRTLETRTPTDITFAERMTTARRRLQDLTGEQRKAAAKRVLLDALAAPPPQNPLGHRLWASHRRLAARYGLTAVTPGDSSDG